MRFVHIDPCSCYKCRLVNQESLVKTLRAALAAAEAERDAAIAERDAAETERDGWREALEQISSNLCFCQAIDSQGRPCDPCVAKAALDGHDWVADALATSADDAGIFADLCPKCGQGIWIETIPEECAKCGYRKPAAGAGEGGRDERG